MPPEILNALIGLAGAITGVLLGFLFQLLLQNHNFKKQKDFDIFKIKMEIYPKIVKYMEIISKFENTINNAIKKQLLEEESKCFNEFYYFLCLITNDKTLSEFEEIRKEILSGHLSQNQAIKKIKKYFKLV